MSDPTSPPTLDYRNPTHIARPPSRRSALAWFVGIVVLLLILFSCFVPRTGRARETAQRVKCASNLRQIGMAIALYANENAGRMPPDWVTLLKTEGFVPEVFTCPSSAVERASGPTPEAMYAELLRGDHLSYALVGGMEKQATSSDVIVAFELELHLPRDSAPGSGINVLLGDGAVTFVDETVARAIRARYFANVRPILLSDCAPPPPTTTPSP